MTDSWDEAFRDLREQFLREVGPRLDGIEQGIERLAQAPADADLLRDLMRQFHGFAGSGGTYGLPSVSALGLEAERRCIRWLADGHVAVPELLEGLRASLTALRGAVAGSGTPVARPETPPPAIPAPRPADVLVVDDDPAVLSYIVRRLEQEGMSSRSAGSKAEALAEMGKRMPDALIVDVRLPDGSGYEVVEAVRQKPGGLTPGILVVSVLAAFLDKVEAIHCGADGFFEKPIDWEALVRRLLHLLERNRAEAGRVLCVEDDRQHASFLRAVLSSAGYEVRICEDPRHFEADLVSCRPDLTVMDILLPGVSGYDLARYLRQDDRYATMPILFLTTEGQIDAQIEVARAGGDDHLVKPIAPALLLTAVASRIERARFVKGLLGRDGLTRLLTHSAFVEQAAVVLGRKQRDPTLAAVWVMIDVDHFKSVNDRYGHPTGDRVLTALSALLRRRLRQTDTIGRYGGEEFAVLLDELTEADAVRLIERLLAEFEALGHTAPDGSTFHVTFSAGIAQLKAPGTTLSEWGQAADSALYAAKAAGRNRVRTQPTAP